MTYLSFCLSLFCLSIWLFFTVFFLRNSLVANIHKTNTHTHLLSSSSPSYVRNQGFSLAPVAGLRGAAGLPVDSHIRSYSLHRNTIIQGEGEAAPSVEYWCRRRAFTRHFREARRRGRPGKEFLRYSLQDQAIFWGEKNQKVAKKGMGFWLAAQEELKGEIKWDWLRLLIGKAQFSCHASKVKVKF